MITGVGIWRESNAEDGIPCTWRADFYCPAATARGEQGYFDLYTLNLRGLSADEAAAKIDALPPSERAQAFGLIARTADLLTPEAP